MPTQTPESEATIEDVKAKKEPQYIYKKDPKFVEVARIAYPEAEIPQGHQTENKYNFHAGLFQFKTTDFDVLQVSIDRVREFAYRSYYKPLKLEKIADQDVQVGAAVLRMFTCWPNSEAVVAVQNVCIAFGLRIADESRIEPDGIWSEHTFGAAVDAAKKHGDRFVWALEAEEYHLLRVRAGGDKKVFEPLIHGKIKGVW